MHSDIGSIFPGPGRISFIADIDQLLFCNNRKNSLKYVIKSSDIFLFLTICFDMTVARICIAAPLFESHVGP